MRAFMRALPPESVVVCDAGTPTPYVTAYYRPAAAGRLFIAGRSHGSLGYALPAAIGAQFGAPGRPVVAAFGDGSFGMVMGELETVARYGLPIVLVAFRNQCYSWIKCLQYYYYGERYHGVDFMPGPDYCAVARAFGIRAVRPESGAGLEQELRHAVAAREPVFIEVAVECMTREVPPVHAWRRDAALPPTERRRVSY
jgi:acetolactate synthase-1/2/3 large subunit